MNKISRKKKKIIAPSRRSIGGIRRNSIGLKDRLLSRRMELRIVLSPMTQFTKTTKLFNDVKSLKRVTRSTLKVLEPNKLKSDPKKRPSTLENRRLNKIKRIEDFHRLRSEIASTSSSENSNDKVRSVFSTSDVTNSSSEIALEKVLPTFNGYKISNAFLFKGKLDFREVKILLEKLPDNVPPSSQNSASAVRGDTVVEYNSCNEPSETVQESQSPASEQCDDVNESYSNESSEPAVLTNEVNTQENDTVIENSLPTELNETDLQKSDALVPAEKPEISNDSNYSELLNEMNIHPCRVVLSRLPDNLTGLPRTNVPVDKNKVRDAASDGKICDLSDELPRDVDKETSGVDLSTISLMMPKIIINKLPFPVESSISAVPAVRCSSISLKETETQNETSRVVLPLSASSENNQRRDESTKSASSLKSSNDASNVQSYELASSVGKFCDSNTEKSQSTESSLRKSTSCEAKSSKHKSPVRSSCVSTPISSSNTSSAQITVSSDVTTCVTCSTTTSSTVKSNSTSTTHLTESKQCSSSQTSSSSSSSKNSIILKFSRSSSSQPYSSSLFLNSAQYTPTASSYSPASSTYTPSSPRYLASSPSYSPSLQNWSFVSGHSPSSPCYAPTTPAYSPSGPVYIPTSPQYTPIFKPTSPQYNPVRTMYQPASPLCNLYEPSSSRYPRPSQSGKQLKTCTQATQTSPQYEVCYVNHVTDSFTSKNEKKSGDSSSTTMAHITPVEYSPRPTSYLENASVNCLEQSPSKLKPIESKPSASSVPEQKSSKDSKSSENRSSSSHRRHLPDRSKSLEKSSSSSLRHHSSDGSKTSHKSSSCRNHESDRSKTSDKSKSSHRHHSSDRSRASHKSGSSHRHHSSNRSSSSHSRSKSVPKLSEYPAKSSTPSTQTSNVVSNVSYPKTNVPVVSSSQTISENISSAPSSPTSRSTSKPSPMPILAPVTETKPKSCSNSSEKEASVTRPSLVVKSVGVLSTPQPQSLLVSSSHSSLTPQVPVTRPVLVKIIPTASGPALSTVKSTAVSSESLWVKVTAVTTSLISTTNQTSVSSSQSFLGTVSSSSTAKPIISSSHSLPAKIPNMSNSTMKPPQSTNPPQALSTYVPTIKPVTVSNYDSSTAKPPYYYVSLAKVPGTPRFLSVTKPNMKPPQVVPIPEPTMSHVSSSQPSMEKPKYSWYIPPVTKPSQVANSQSSFVRVSTVSSSCPSTVNIPYAPRSRPFVAIRLPEPSSSSIRYPHSSSTQHTFVKPAPITTPRRNKTPPNRFKPITSSNSSTFNRCLPSGPSYSPTYSKFLTKGLDHMPAMKYKPAQPSRPLTSRSYTSNFPTLPSQNPSPSFLPAPNLVRPIISFYNSSSDSSYSLNSSTSSDPAYSPLSPRYFDGGA